jgi:hypothetical protein
VVISDELSVEEAGDSYYYSRRTEWEGRCRRAGNACLGSLYMNKDLYISKDSQEDDDDDDVTIV